MLKSLRAPILIAFTGSFSVGAAPGHPESDIRSHVRSTRSAAIRFLVVYFALAVVFLLPKVTCAQESTRGVLPSTGPLEDEVQGRQDAPVTIVEYASVTCNCCVKFHQAVYPTLKSQFIDTGKVRFIIRGFPLDQLAAAGFMLARCVGDDKYFAFIDALMKRPAEWIVRQPLPPLLNIANEFGLEPEKAKVCLSDQKLLEGIQEVRDRAAGRLDHIPALFINGIPLDQMTDWDTPTLIQLKNVLEKYKGFGCGVTDESLPDDARGFVNWCKKNGLNTRDVQGRTCSFTILVDSTGPSESCPSFVEALLHVKDADADRLDEMILQWIAVHPDHMNGTAESAIEAASTALHGCKYKH